MPKSLILLNSSLLPNHNLDHASLAFEAVFHIVYPSDDLPLTPSRDEWRDLIGSRKSTAPDHRVYHRFSQSYAARDLFELEESLRQHSLRFRRFGSIIVVVLRLLGHVLRPMSLRREGGTLRRTQGAQDRSWHDRRHLLAGRARAPRNNILPGRTTHRAAGECATMSCFVVS